MGEDDVKLLEQGSLATLVGPGVISVISDGNAYSLENMNSENCVNSKDAHCLGQCPCADYEPKVQVN